MEPITYYVKLNKDSDGSFMAEFPQLGGFSHGASEPEALHNAEDLLVCLIEDKIKTGEVIPLPKAIKNCRAVMLDAGAAAKLFLYWEMKKQGIKKAALARKLNWHAPQVDRLLDVRHESKLSQLQLAFAALGRRVALTVV